MSSQLKGSACTTNSRQLLIGLDGIAVLASNETHATRRPAADDIGGVNNPIVLTGVPVAADRRRPRTRTARRCRRDDLRRRSRQYCQRRRYDARAAPRPRAALRTGRTRSTTATAPAATTGRTCSGRRSTAASTHQRRSRRSPTRPRSNADGTAGLLAGGRAGERNAARVDCANPVRGVLLASYSSIVRTPSCVLPSPAISCDQQRELPARPDLQHDLRLIGQPQDCVKVKHAFRRDDSSGTTDAFNALVGLDARSRRSQRSAAGRGANQPEVADTAAVPRSRSATPARRP